VDRSDQLLDALDLEQSALVLVMRAARVGSSVLA
jgi:hypothetical protein